MSKSSKLNDIGTYDQLNQRASRNGYKIESIIYNGYISSSELQSIQDKAMQSRTQLRLNSDIEKQKNELIDLKLASNNKRFGIESNLSMLKCQFEQKLNQEKKNFEIELMEADHTCHVAIKNMEQSSLNEIKSNETKLKEDYLQNLKSLAINVNNYEIEMARSKHKVDKLYQLIN